MLLQDSESQSLSLCLCTTKVSDLRVPRRFLKLLQPNKAVIRSLRVTVSPRLRVSASPCLAGLLVAAPPPMCLCGEHPADIRAEAFDIRAEAFDIRANRRNFRAKSGNFRASGLEGWPILASVPYICAMHNDFQFLGHAFKGLHERWRKKFRVQWKASSPRHHPFSPFLRRRPCP